jgi:hypothetical protein
MAGKGSKPGERRGGRQKGTPNKATLEREEKARQEIAEALKKAGTAKTVRYAIDEMQKALVIAEGFAGLVQPTPIKDANGKLVKFEGGDVELFGTWFDKWFTCIKELAKYQTPQVKAIEAPTPPPDPQDLERRSRKRFGLRIFEGGRPPGPIPPTANGKDREAS